MSFRRDRPSSLDTHRRKGAQTPPPVEFSADDVVISGPMPEALCFGYIFEFITCEEFDDDASPIRVGDQEHCASSPLSFGRSPLCS